MKKDGYEYVLFDLDGTVVDVSPWYVTSVIDRVGETIGYQFSDHQAERLWHGLGGSPDQLLDVWGIDSSTFWQAFHDIESAEDRAAATFLYPDAEQISHIEQPVGLVTHCQPYLTEPVLDHLDIADWFDTIVCCHDDLGWKPAAEPIRHARSKLAVNERSDGVLIGDSAIDIGAAWNAGIDGIHIERHGHDRRGCCIRADTQVDTLTELFDSTEHTITADPIPY